ncbi:MAG: hypothetical protein WAN40_06505, partial [Thermoplasmata archaeon]
SRTEGTIDEVLRRVQESGGKGLRWVVNSRTSPADVGERLLQRGFERLTTAETLYLALGTKTEPHSPSVRPTGAITAREVFTDREIEVFVRMGETIFGDPSPPPEYAKGFLSEVHRSIEATGHSELFLSFDGPVPVGRGGLSVTGPVGRLWTAGVLEDHRGKGAYKALTTARCKSALDQGAEIVLTHARVGTSGPTLKKMGFRSAGPYLYSEIRSI